MSGSATVSAPKALEQQNNGMTSAGNDKITTIHNENASNNKIGNNKNNNPAENSNGAIVKSEQNKAGEQTGIPLGVISIQDLEAGKVDLDAVLTEVKTLRKKISQLRYEMCQYFITLSSIDDNTIPSVAYNQVATQVSILKKSCESYTEMYKNLLPVIRDAKLKRGLGPNEEMKVVKHEVPMASAKPPTTASSGKNSKRSGTAKKSRGRKRKKN